MLEPMSPERLMLAVDEARNRYRTDVNSAHQARLGQFFTSRVTALRLASMFRGERDHVRLLDAGAGVGVLTAAFVVMMVSRHVRPRSLDLTAVELDPALMTELKATLMACARLCEEHDIHCTWRVEHTDFILASVASLETGLFADGRKSLFDAAILNPPYKKISAGSKERQALESVGITASNLYPAFVALAALRLAPGGELVAITPRSWCNGAYFEPFRRLLLRETSIEHIHVYGSRTATFKDDAVLTENVIYRVVRGSQAPLVTVTESAGPDASTTLERCVPFERVVYPADPHAYVHISPAADSYDIADAVKTLPANLAVLGLQASTGRVVDFRARKWLRADPGVDTLPLIYPTHFGRSHVEWPRSGGKKANALSADTPDELLVPSGFYVLTKRFTSKEERRRLVATVFDPTHVPGLRVGFENHLNYFHAGGRPMEPELAYGLAAYLNSQAVDDYFRQFSGHTQVNATDLRTLRYPDVAVLHAVGADVMVGDLVGAETRIARALARESAAA
jgi:adenine-specific DNA-methyltransferase